MFFWPDLYAANITVTTDRDPAVVNESFVMIFESDADVDGDPDFSPLNSDFQILSTGESSNMTIVNGRISTTKRWTLYVIARHTGKLDIPSISFGNDRSTPSSINVVKEDPGGVAGNEREIFLEVEASPKNPYVQSEVIYKIRLFRAVATANASLSDPPEVKGATAVVEKIGEDRSYDTRLNGKLYGVVEREYAVFPQASGPLTIEPIIFQGQVSRGSSFFSSPFGRQPRTVVIQSDPVTLDVRAIPAAFNGKHWLPAKNITITEEWSDYPLEFELDQPLTRTVTVTAKGLTASQLPVLPEWKSSAFKQYPDQPTLEDDKRISGITGKRVEKIAMIPNQAGTFTLPEIKIPWWNTDSNKMEYATLPEREVLIKSPAAERNSSFPGVSPPPKVDLTLPEIGIGQETQGTEAGESQSLNRNADQNREILWQVISLSLLVVWLITLVLWRRAKKKGGFSAGDDEGKSSIRISVREFKQACMDNNPVLAKEKIISWGRLHWPDRPPASIGEISNRSSKDLAIELNLLNNVLYSRDGSDWRGRDLWLAFQKELKTFEVKKEQDKGKLEPLFKI